MHPFTTSRRRGPTGWNTALRGTFAEIAENDTVLLRSKSYQNSADKTTKSIARAVKGLFSLDNPDGVVAVTNAPLARHSQGYFIEVEVLGVNTGNDDGIGCLGLGVSFLKPEVQIEKIPRRLEKIEQGWFFSGPYYGQTRRLYSI